MLFVFFGLPVFSGRIEKSYFYTEQTEICKFLIVPNALFYEALGYKMNILLARTFRLKMKTRKCSPYVNELSVVVAFKKFAFNFMLKISLCHDQQFKNIRFRQPLSFCMENLQIPLLNKAILITWQRNICS